MKAPYYTKTQVDSKVDDLEVQISNISDGTSGKAYPDLESAMGVIPLPNNGIIFTIDEANEVEKGVYAYDSTEINGYRFVREIGAPLLKSEYSEEETILGKNLFDKETMYITGYAISTTTGARTVSATSTIGRIENGIEPNTIYSISGRSAASGSRAALTCITSTGTRVVPKTITDDNRPNHSTSIGNSNFKTPADCVAIEFTIAFTTTPDTFVNTLQVELGANATSYEPYSLIKYDRLKKEKLPNDVAYLNDIPDVTSSVKTINIHNVPMMLLTGASHLEVNGIFKNKGLVNYLSTLSDWNWENYSRSGSTHIATFNAIMTDTERYGVRVSELTAGGHCIIALGGNEVAYYTNIDGSYFKDNIIRLTSAIKSLGFKPIYMSQFGGYQHPFATIIKDVANSEGVLFIDADSYGDRFWNPRFLPFWFNGHTGTRLEHIKIHPIMRILNDSGFVRPTKSMKLFRPRLESISNISELLYDGNFDRMSKWIEVSVGHKMLKEDKENYYDRLDKVVASDHENANSEYNSLRRGNALSFEEYALVNFVAEDILSSLNKVSFSFETNEEVNVYVRNYVNSSLLVSTAGSSCIFTLEEPASIPLSTVLTDSNNPTFTFTVIEINGNDVITNPSADGWETAGATYGVLSYETNEYVYNYSKAGVSPTYLDNAKKPKGRWVDIEKDENDVYDITNLKVNSNYDKIEFLITSESTFELNKLELSYSGGNKKTDANSYKFGSLTEVFNDELLNQETTFNNIDDSDDWTFNNSNGSELFDGNVTYLDKNEDSVIRSIIPSFYTGNQILKLKNNDSILSKFAIPTITNGYINKVSIAIVGRYAPVFNDDETNLTNPLTQNTFDFRKVEVIVRKYGFVYSKEIWLNLWWNEHVIDFELDYTPGTATIEIKSTDDDIELLNIEIKK